MSMYIEVKPLKTVPKNELNFLLEHYTFPAGWMRPIVRGFVEQRKPWWGRSRNYNRAYVLIAKENDKMLGWAVVRIPQRETRIRRDRHSFVPTKYAYGGRRPDFMTFIGRAHRKKGVARNLLIAAYNNFGTLDVYPHDEASEKFYSKNNRFVVPCHSGDFVYEDFKAREV